MSGLPKWGVCPVERNSPNEPQSLTCRAFLVSQGSGPTCQTLLTQAVALSAESWKWKPKTALSWDVRPVAGAMEHTFFYYFDSPPNKVKYAMLPNDY